MTTAARTYRADAVAAGTSLYPHPRPVLNTPTLAEAIRVQLHTWVVSELSMTVPGPHTLTDAPADRVARLLTQATTYYEHFGTDACSDAEAWGAAHLFHAYADSLHAAHAAHGDARLLGCLYSLIAARAHLKDGHEQRIDLNPFGCQRPTLDEIALIETIRMQLTTWVPKRLGTVVHLPPRWQQRTPADASDLLANVIQAAEAAYGDADDDDSVRGMAHLANAYAHSLKAAYGHGDAHLFAALNSLILTAACLT
ncbi:hypothetical protein ABT160_45470 [Streptomyces sp. NPDC001941]|uniref:hypothetical protein n=1 Tax=Streptomyces sp. NPDC001941 TaxID=3154659 RepID=UPI00331CDAAE